MNPFFRVLLADDHPIVRQGLLSLLVRAGHDVIGEAGDGESAVRQAIELQPDVAILDLSMPVLNGLEAAGEISRAAPRVRVVLLTMHTDKVYVLQAIRLGIRGYVLKSQAADDLLRALSEIMRGHLYLSPGISEAVVEGYLEGSAAQVDALTARQRQILKLIAAGLTSKEMARELNISARTVDSHRCQLMAKLDIHDLAGLVRYAIQRGMTPP